MRKNLIFDVGNVLLEYRWKDMLLDHGLSEAEAEEVGSVVFGDNSWNLMDLGNMSVDEVIEEFRRLAPEHIEDIEWFITHGEYMHVKREDIWEKVHRLKQMGYFIYVLSNYSDELFHKHTKGASFLDDLDGMVVSYQIHCVKPEPEIYHYILDKYQLDPKTCVFFDDRADNTKTADELGIETYTITSKEYLHGVLDVFLKEKD